MKKVQSIIKTIGVGILLTGMIGCSGRKQNDSTIYFLSRKPEVAGTWERIAQEYEQETGIRVKVLTSANGNHERTLKAEIAKKEMPTIFQVTGSAEYEVWKNYCIDLQNTDLYEWLLDKDISVGDESGVYGIPYVVEGYGIIYNHAIMEKYFTLSTRETSYQTMEDIKSYEALRAVAEDMTKHKAELGIEGVFAATSFAPSEDWRWSTHLLNLPIFYEFRADQITDKQKLDFTYSQAYKNIFDLYIQNSTVSPLIIDTKKVSDSMTEFALGKAAMVQNGNWAWEQISATEGCVVGENEIGYLPIYTGAEGEEAQGLCIGTENYICINSLASKEQQDASIAFLEWLYSSEKGKDYVVNELGFIAPFSTFSEQEQPDNPLAKQIIADMNDNKTFTVNWVFATFPDQAFKDNFGAALRKYAKQLMSWEEIARATKEEWAQKKATGQE